MDTAMFTFHLNGVQLAINEIACSRCGGSGHYSYCQMHGTVCFKCGGTGKVYSQPKGQPKIETTCQRLEDAKVGDIISVHYLYYQVISTTWTEGKWKGWDYLNQRMVAVRLHDGKRVAFKRGVSRLDVDMTHGYGIVNGVKEPLMRSYTPTPEQVGQIVIEDIPAPLPVQEQVGNVLIVALPEGYGLRVLNENGVQVYIPGRTKIYSSPSVARTQARKITSSDGATPA